MSLSVAAYIEGVTATSPFCAGAASADDAIADGVTAAAGSSLAFGGASAGEERGRAVAHDERRIPEIAMAAPR